MKNSISENFRVQTEPFWMVLPAFESHTSTEFSIPDFDVFDPISGIPD
ncbi:MAG: hypothetical protein OXI44_02465 [Bacteroidota bacterium]|nr:hypothetical protein [Bacteroidota bacterium]